jgi:hypothetical protein
LARDHEREDLRDQLRELARNPRREAVRGIAAAALYDTGDTEASLELGDELAQSKQLATLTWGNLLQAARAGRLVNKSIVVEPTFRRVQLGWVE